MAALIIRLALFISLLITCALAGATPQTDVLVRPTSEVVAADVKLADLGSVQSTDKAVTEKLKAVPICPSPLPGKTRMVTREQILIALRRQGISDDSTNLVCPAQVSITRSSSVVTGQALFDTVREFVTTKTSWPGTSAVEPVRLPPDQTVPKRNVELRVRAGSQRIKKGRNSFPVEIVVDGRVYITTHVSVVIRVFAPVLIATQSIARSAEISSSNTALQDREITNLPDDVVLQSPAADATAAVPIAEAAIIRASWITRPPAIRSGDTVTVLVSGKFVRVTDKGTAAADGRPGDRIKVRLAGDVREVRGTVVKPGLVEITLGRRNQ